MKRSLSSGLLAVAVGLVTAGIAHAGVKLAGVFGDHMVLQQGRPIPVWGTADSGETVEVKIIKPDGSTLGIKSAAADDKGAWRVELDALEADGAPVELTATGKTSKTIKDVLLGEVWLASGQSNMQYGLKSDRDGAELWETANHPQIRFTSSGPVPTLDPLKDRGFKWAVCEPEIAKSFSAVAYYFATDLQKLKNVPVGVIGAYVSGTPCESWTPMAAFETSPVLKRFVDAQAAARQTASTQPANAKLSAGVPSSLYNGMIAPLGDFSLAGVIWYQGESNVGRADEYRALFPAMIKAWRQQFKRDDLPFLFVQLPGFKERQTEPKPSEWAKMREAQESALSLDHTGMVVTIDLSSANTILHPKSKRDVGGRLAKLSQVVAYGEDAYVEGPKYADVKFEANQVRLHYVRTAGGLKIAVPPQEDPSKPATTPADKLLGYWLAGDDKKWFFADAAIEGKDTVIVKSSSVPKPVAVRYGWGQNPEVNLYNKVDLPAVPFRSDDWDDGPERKGGPKPD